jgi:hypothetical protein
MAPAPTILIKLEMYLVAMQPRGEKVLLGTSPQDWLDFAAHENEGTIIIRRGKVPSRFQLPKPVLRKRSLLQEHIQLRRAHSSAAFPKVTGFVFVFF